MNKGSKYKSGQRPTFRIWDNEKNDWFEPTYEGWDGKIEELLLSPTGDLAMRTFTDFKRESIFPERFEIVLDEPQKVKVPAYVAEWIELCKEKADASSCLNGYYEIGNGTIVRPRGFSEEFYDWLADCNHMDDLTRAWLDGYEVEQEQKWVVKSNQLYFTGVTQLIAHDPLTYNFVKDQKHAHIFDDKKSAEKEASFFDGTIEKVEE